MRCGAWAGSLRTIPLLTALGVALSGCVCCGPRHFGDDGRRPSYCPNQVTEIDYIKALAGKR